MSLDVTSNAAQVATGLTASLVDDAASRADQAAAETAVGLVDAQTPRRPGTLAAGARVAVASEGWAIVNPVPYSVKVDNRTGYATKTLRDNEDRLVAIYENELQREFDET